jgi:type IV pilus assembly protein PilV
MVTRTRTRRRSRDERGLTLIEVLVALTLFALGALALAALVPAGTRTVSKAGEDTRASELAAQCMERLLDTPYGDPALDAGTHNDAQNPHAGRYWVSWQVEDNQPVGLCKRITVRVRWPASASPTLVRLVAVAAESSW